MHLIATRDRISIINPVPDFYGGIENSFSYKGFSLNFFFDFRKQTGVSLFGTNHFCQGVLVISQLHYQMSGMHLAI